MHIKQTICWERKRQSAAKCWNRVALLTVMELSLSIKIVCLLERNEKDGNPNWKRKKCDKRIERETL